MSRHRRHSRYEEDYRERDYRDRDYREGDYQESDEQQVNSPLGNFNINNLASIINGIDVNQLTDAINRAGEDVDNSDPEHEANNADIIRSLRTLINSDKVLLLQTILQLFAISRGQRK